MISDYVRFIRFKKDLACDAFTVGLTVQRDIVVRGGTGWADATMQSLRQIILGPEASGAKRFRQSLSFQDPSSSAFRLVVEASRTKVGLSFGWKHCNPLETPTNNVSCACTCGCTRYSNLMTLEPKTQGHRVNMCQVWTGAWIYLQGHAPRGGTNTTNVALSCSCKVFSSAIVSILLYVGFAPVVLTIQQANIESAEWMQHK